MTQEYSKQSAKEYISRISRGTHMCSIYRDKAEQFELLIPFMASALKNNERSIYIGDDLYKEEVINEFSRLGIDVKNAEKWEQFAFYTKEQTYVTEGYFSPEKMIAFLKEAQQDALVHGYDGMRVTGEMTWVLANLPGSDKLIEYEAKLNYFLPESQTSAICQYNEHRFSASILLDVLLTHPLVIVYGVLCENPYYLDPDSFFTLQEEKKGKLVYEEVRDHLLKRAPHGT